MGHVFFSLGLAGAICGWGWSSLAHAQAVTAGLQESGDPPHVLVAHNGACKERALAAGLRARNAEERAILADQGADAVEPSVIAVKVKRRGTRRSSDPTSGHRVNEETRRQLDELLLLDALRRAGQR